MFSNNTTTTTSNSDSTNNEFVIVNVIIAILVILVNTFVAFLFYKKRILLNTPSNRLLLSLCICDLLAGMAVTCHCMIEFQICNRCLAFRIFLEIITSMLVESVVMHLCGITLDRFLSLFYALRYKDIVTKKKAMQFIVIAWMTSLITSSMQLIWLYRVIDGNPSISDYEKIDDIEAWYSASLFVLFFTLPMILLGTVFVVMFIEIRRLLLKTPSRRMRDVSGISVQQRRVFYIFGFMYLSFVLFSMPFFIMRFMLDLQHYAKHGAMPSKHLLDIGYTFKSLNSLINPIIYTANNREFRSLIGGLFSSTRNKFIFPFRKLSSAASLNVSLRRRSNPITSVADPSIHDSGIYEVYIGETSSVIENNSPTTVVSVIPNNLQLKFVYKNCNHNLLS